MGNPARYKVGGIYQATYGDQGAVFVIDSIYEDGSLEVTCLHGAWTGRYLPKEEMINPYGDRYVPSLLVEPYDDFGKSFLED